MEYNRDEVTWSKVLIDRKVAHWCPRSKKIKVPTRRDKDTEKNDATTSRRKVLLALL